MIRKCVVLVLATKNAWSQVQLEKGAIWQAKTTSYWKKLPGSVFSEFLAKPDA
jgi:hypothetical protein